MVPRSGACTVIGAPASARVDVGTCRVGVRYCSCLLGWVGGCDDTMQDMRKANRRFDVRRANLLYSAGEGSRTRMERTLHDGNEASNLYELKRRNILI